ncbi:MAG: hypothetical protein LAN84_12845 [Acidobacteriia bacterium]|nr:hypothetical protein [Terriglobia bacterium]
MRRRQAGVWCGVASLCAMAAALPAQEKPLLRTFAQGAAESYRVEVTVRSELRGVRPETIGAKTYVRPFTQAAEATMTWNAARRIVAVLADGSAEIEETREPVSAAYRCEPEEDPAARKLQEALRVVGAKWEQPLVLRYREARDGHLQGLQAQEAAGFGEEQPRLLTPWLRHALRPSVLLPAAPLRFGERWQRRPQGPVPPWSAVQGAETGEWAAAPGDAPAATLHVTQELTGEIPPAGTPGAAAVQHEPAARRGSFFADALSTVSLLDGSLLSAVRSAARETSWTLAPVEGLPEPPRFAAKLSVSVTIRRRP